jgi:hypothetical protein
MARSLAMLVALILLFGVAFFLVGFVSRRVAGPRPARGWVGFLTVLAFVVVSRLLPYYQWNYASYPRWFYGAGFDYTTLIWLILLLLALGLACLGDKVAMGLQAERR